MFEVFNFHDSWFVAESNWVWLAVSLGLGVWFGWATSTGETDDKSGRP